jgi:hypothetical protein
MSDSRPVAVERIEEPSRLSDPYAELLVWCAANSDLVADQLLAVRMGGVTCEDVDLGLRLGNQIAAAVDGGVRDFAPQVGDAAREGNR